MCSIKKRKTCGSAPMLSTSMSFHLFSLAKTQINLRISGQRKYNVFVWGSSGQLIIYGV